MWANNLRLQKSFIFITLTIISVTTWTYMMYLVQTMKMDNMLNAWMPPQTGYAWSVIDFTQTFIMWVVMMASMMMPTVIQMALSFVTIFNTRNPHKSTYLASVFFISGYFLMWLLFSIAMTVLQWQLHEQAILTPMMESHNLVFSALILIMAGAYQITTIKSVCLTHCRDAHYISDDCHSSPVLMGMHHGVYCVGACWALMLIMFVVGVMNVMWMSVITFMVLLEKFYPFKPIWLDYISGFSLLIWGAYLLITSDFFKLILPIIELMMWACSHL